MAGSSAPPPRRIAFVHSGIRADQLTEAAGPFWVRRFYETLRGLGDIEGGNLAVERYSAEGRTERFAALAAEVVGRNPEVIVVNLNDLTKTFMTATATIPIVAITQDPVAAGLIRSLAHPGGNLTGVSVDAGVAIVAKRMQILKEAMPRAAKAAYLLSNAWDDRTESSYREAAKQMGIALTGNFISEINDAELHRAFAEMAQQQIDAALVDEGGSFLAHRALLAELAEKYRLPVIYPYRDYVDLGGLMTYAPDLGELAQRMANDVHQILGGAKPGDIPYFQPTKFLLIVNLKAAKALGLDLPPTLILRADEVIE
ncbi:ABC transporter substrate-binding protein [Bradyrhizobium sp.]|uniref:ABC transporter substrate-binding protein n=1 Tax=Bradyrhizobium sp. TaxID=376 RepID=UPI003C764F40